MALEQDIEVMSVQPILGLLPREGLRLLAFAAETRFLRTGDVLFRKGDLADGAYLVITGSIALDPRDDGSPADQIATPGFLLGETALFAEVGRPATAVARETTTVMKIARSVMNRVLGEFPETAAVLHRAISERVMALSDDLARVRHQITAAGD
ncbi:MAG: cyclic nucleotide-binding domain-containing protein [Beijerinckiaceae bacterium]|jgi:CRP-like cAMP-binding protein|nr:cyclic nucleotide-binding domain-containing protein [Beijerinckiaceae bacterium]